MSTRSGRRLAALAALGTLAGVWGYNWVVMKQALQYAAPFTFAALRTTLGTASLFVLLALLRRPLAPRAVARTAALGVLQTTGFVGLITWALVRGGAGKTAVLAYTMPFWLLVLAMPLLGERIRGLQWLAVALAFAGLLALVEPWNLGGLTLSALLPVAAAVSWALSAIVAKRLRREVEVDLVSLAAWQMLFGAAPLVVIAWLVPAAPVQWTPYFIGALAYNALAATALAWVLWMFALQELPAGMAGMGTLLTPLVGVMAAWIQLGERPGGWEAVGMVLIFAALALLAGRGAGGPRVRSDA